MSTIPESEMPAPRLELRWVDLKEPVNGDFEWTVECIYSLVLKLGEHDIRGERSDDDGNDLPKVDTISFEMNRTRSTGTAASRYYLKKWGQDKVDTPFRDHAHAHWDAEQLGYLPIYAVAGGRAMLVTK